MASAGEFQESEGPAHRGGECAPGSRVERIILVGRLVLVLFWLLTFRLHPSGSTEGASTVLAVLVAYLLYVVAGGRHVWTGRPPASRWRVVDQALEGVLWLFLVSLAGAASGPLVAYLSFPILFATLRWQWRGALAVGVPTTLGFVGPGVVRGLVGGPQVEWSTLIVPTAYLVTLTAVLCHVGVHERRARRTMVGVATWSPPTGVDAPHVEPILATAAAVLGAPRAVLAWTERDDDPLHVAFLTGREVTAWDDESWAAEELVAARFAHVDFLCRDAGAPASATTWIADGRLGRRRGAGAVPLAVRHRFAMRSVMAVRLHGERVRGRLFLLDMPDLTADDLVTGGMLARHVERCLEDRVTARRFAAASAAEERVQLGRDVHDGALQSLAGIRLQLEAARRLLVTRPHETESILRELQDVVAVEQHSLRRVVSRLQYAGTLAGHELDHDDLADRITALVLRIERQWSVRMQVLTPIVHADFDAVIPLGLGEEIYQILREALINAARHARATTVMVSLGLEDDAVRLTIVDDGEGFPFTGCYDLPRLIRLDMGPAVLRSRVAGQGGALTIDSSRQGSRLEISIPFQPPVRVSVPAG